MAIRAALLVAETGGHLEQLTQLEPRLSPSFARAEYATSVSPQSESLLTGRTVHYGPAIGPRDWRTALRTLAKARRTLRLGEYTDVVSTGSAVAVPYLVAARTLGLNAHYIESAARTTGPSLSGRILRYVPGVNLYAQYPIWAKSPWRYAGSVLDGYSPVVSAAEPPKARRVVVTLGTMRQYPFDRAVKAVMAVLPQVADPGCEIFWQLGEARSGHLPGRAHPTVSAAELRSEISQADLVFAHAGTGSALSILESGRVPVLLTRSQAHGEHVDDHQLLIAGILAERGLAVSIDPDALTPQLVRQAMSSQVRREKHPAALVLEVSPRRWFRAGRGARPNSYRDAGPLNGKGV